MENNAFLKQNFAKFFDYYLNKIIFFYIFYVCFFLKIFIAIHVSFLNFKIFIPFIHRCLIYLLKRYPLIYLICYCCSKYFNFM